MTPFSTPSPRPSAGRTPPRPSPRGWLRTAVGALAVALALSGCGSGAPDPVRVVIVTAPAIEQPQPRLDQADRALLRAAAETDAGTAELLVAGDPAAGATFDLTARRETGAGRAEVEHGPARAGMIDARVDEVAAAVDALAPVVGEPDLLRTITEAARTGPAGTMIVDASGVSTVDPLDLRVLGWDAAPEAVLDDLAARGFLPDLTGWSLRFTALGAVAGPQPQLPEPQRRWLERLWTLLCERSGAQRCELAPHPGAPAPPHSPRAGGLVPVPDVGTVRHDDGTVVTTLPAARLGFTEGSAELAPTAADALAEVVAQAGDGRHAVRVEGFVAFWGTPEYRLDLSERRARAVAELLVACGVPAERVEWAGRGAADGPEASQTAGAFDEAKVQSNGLRRVTVTVGPLPGGTP